MKAFVETQMFASYTDELLRQWNESRHADK